MPPPPSIKRTPNQDLKKLYKAIENNISEASQRNEKLVLIGDFNCKVGNCFQGNTETKTKGGRLLLKMVEKHYVWSMQIATVKEYGYGSRTKKSL